MSIFTNHQPSRMTRVQFLATFGGICENSPWVMQKVWQEGMHETHDTVEGLHAAICAAIDNASAADQDALLNAHPRLAGKKTREGSLSATSTVEQHSAGLDTLNEQEYAHWADLNHKYYTRFGFPFIMAVRGRNKDEILSAFVLRLNNSHDEERATALAQVKQIILLRLRAL